MASQRQECEVKIAGLLDLPTLLNLGGELLGQGTQKDVYLAGHGTWRIREEKGQFCLTQKEEDVGETARVKGVSARVLSQEEADQLIRDRGVRVLVCKQRTWVRLDDSVIRLDEVEHLGTFTEISSRDEAGLMRALARLGIDQGRLIRQSYLELMIARSLPRWVQLALHFHDRVGELAFGITSGILTTLGVLVGVNSATASQLSVIASVVSIAIADSCSDAFGMYMAKVSERGMPRHLALRFAFRTLIAKACLPLTFLLPLLTLPLNGAVWVDLAWGAVALALLSAEQAIVDQQSIARRIGRNLTFALVIVLNSLLAGRLVKLLSDP
jgi:predicted adenylyl cyclase CyaB